MKDWLLAGLVYVPAFLIGQWISDHQSVISAFWCGWIFGGGAVLIRMHYKVTTGSLVVTRT